MSDWTEGYVTDLGYTYGYYEELNPIRARLGLLHAGVPMPDLANACELGFGQGVSVNIHSVASQTQWYGTDFNPTQAAFARSLAFSGKSGAKLYDDSFEEFHRRDDLPMFDFIGLHGIWTWVSDANRGVIVDFIRKRLNVGGIVYVSYNCLPAWTPYTPIRKLIADHAETMGARGEDLTKRIDSALAFAEKLLGLQPAYLRSVPGALDRLKNLIGYDRNYLAHEYFNRDWKPMYFSEIAELMQAAKLDFVCSTNEIDEVEGINYTPEQQAFLSDIPDKAFRETVRGYITGQQFRKDYWVRGPQKLLESHQEDALLQHRVILAVPRDAVPMKVVGAKGEIALVEEFYKPFLELMGDHKPRSIAQIDQALKGKSLSLGQILQVVMVLSGAGHLRAVQDEPAIAKAAKLAGKFNSMLVERALASNQISILASPVTGGGIGAGRFSQIFLAAIARGIEKPNGWAQFAWETLASRGERVVKEGKILETDADNKSELAEQAQDFLVKGLPVLRGLKIA